MHRLIHSQSVLWDAGVKRVKHGKNKRVPVLWEVASVSVCIESSRWLRVMRQEVQLVRLLFLGTRKPVNAGTLMTQRNGSCVLSFPSAVIRHQRISEV